jgi:methylated-DNA-protein-cysteine methyltransferase related protein
MVRTERKTGGFLKASQPRTHDPDTELYRRICAVVQRIPAGRVATYGQVARIVGHCSARTVGYAMAALPADTDIPWHRVINSRGMISPRRRGDGDERQRQRLEGEAVRFDAKGRVDLSRVRWQCFGIGPALVRPRALRR